MNTSYRRLIAWSLLATVVVLALSAGIGKAAPRVPVGGDCDSPLLAASYELGAPCVPYDICTSDGNGNNTTLWAAVPCSENDRMAQCAAIVEQFQMIPWPCNDLTELFDVCDPDGSRRWSITPCDYQPAAEIGDPQVIDKALPITGSMTSTLAKIGGVVLILGLLCLAVKAACDDIDSDGPL